MKRYLLFDSGCSTCSHAAALVQKECGDWLEVRGLNDRAMRSLLAKAKPHWKWEPMLLTVDEENTVVYAGIQMSMRLLRRLGIRSTLNVAKIISTKLVGQDLDPTRRSFLRSSGFLMAGVLLGIGGIKLPPPPTPPTRVHRPRPQESIDEQDILPQETEIHDGFLILPVGKAIPGFVEMPPEIVVGHGADVAPSEVHGETLIFEQKSQLDSCLPDRAYAAEFPKDTTLMYASLTRYVRSKEPYSYSIVFGAYDQQANTTLSTFHISGYYFFPQPYPIMRSDLATIDPAYDIQTINLLSTPGIVVRTFEGYNYYWIENDVLYIAVAQTAIRFDTFRELIASLSKNTID